MNPPRPSRLLLALVLVGLLAVAGWWTWSQRPQGTGGDPGAYDVSVVGPDGPWWNGTTVVHEAATVLSVTQAAARGNFSLHVEQQALGAYVRGIGPYEETSSGGWNFCVDSGAGYKWVGVAVDQRALHAGERVQWRWAEDGSEVC